MSVSISTPSGRTMASAATVAPSATASQKSSASANPTALDRASARYRAAQSRYRQAKAALKAIKRQIVPVDAFGNRKPRLRGWLHLATLPLCIAASIVLICIAPAGSVKAACAVYGASAMLLFGNSALLHVVPWRSAKVTRVLCGIDYSNIFLIIAGTNTPVLFALSPAIRRPYLTVIWVTAAIGTILHIVWLRTPNWVFTTVYVVLGLAPVTLIPQLWTAPAVGPAATILIACGGAAYIAGAVCLRCASRSDSRLVRVPRGVSLGHGHRVRLPRRGDLSDCLRAVGLRTVRAAQQTTRTPSIHEYFQAVRAICTAVPDAVTISIPLSAPSTS